MLDKPLSTRTEVSLQPRPHRRWDASAQEDDLPFQFCRRNWSYIWRPFFFRVSILLLISFAENCRSWSISLEYLFTALIADFSFSNLVTIYLSVWCTSSAQTSSNFCSNSSKNMAGGMASEGGRKVTVFNFAQTKARIKQRDQKATIYFWRKRVKFSSSSLGKHSNTFPPSLRYWHRNGFSNYHGTRSGQKRGHVQKSLWWYTPWQTRYRRVSHP